MAAVATGAAILAGVVSGCATTQQTASWIRLNNARTDASQSDTRVTAMSASVTPEQVSLVRSRRSSAYIVTVHNAGDSAAGDLPILVGYTTGRHARVYLNGGNSLSYFDAHLPTILAHRSLTWVFTTSRTIPAGAHPFALVGATPQPAVSSSTQPIALSVRVRHSAGDRLSLLVTNNSGIPQYQLQIYAYARHAGRYVAAANATVRGLNPGSRELVKLTLVGKPGTAVPVIAAVPTILK